MGTRKDHEETVSSGLAFFFFLSLFILSEKRDSAIQGGGQRERESKGERITLLVWSMTQGSIPQTVRSRPELKSGVGLLANIATQAFQAWHLNTPVEQLFLRGIANRFGAELLWVLICQMHVVEGFFKHKCTFGGTWVVQSVEHPTLAQVMISQFVSSSPASGSVLTACSEPGACFRFCVSSFCPSPTHALSHSVSQK